MKKILVIEDTFEVRDNLCEILELAGYEVESAENGKLGIEKLRSFSPDLILCDVMMPVLDGFGVLKIINKNPAYNHIPFIFLTAKAEKTDFRKGMGLGAEDYITKPFDDTDLLDAIEMRLAKAERIKSSFDGSEQGVQRFFSEAKAEEQLEKLSLDREIRSYKTKDMIFEEGQNPRWLYFLIDGKVKLFQTNDYGKELTTELLGPGEFFGYSALVNHSKYANNAACLEDCNVRLIPKEDFSILLFNNRDFGARFIKMMANKKLDTEKQLIDLAYGSVRKKVANALITFAKSTQTAIDQPIKIVAPREELAKTAGTAKETLIRTLSDFRSEDLIDIHPNFIEIKNLVNLTDILG